MKEEISYPHGSRNSFFDTPRCNGCSLVHAGSGPRDPLAPPVIDINFPTMTSNKPLPAYYHSKGRPYHTAIAPAGPPLSLESTKTLTHPSRTGAFTVRDDPLPAYESTFTFPYKRATVFRRTCFGDNQWI